MSLILIISVELRIDYICFKVTGGLVPTQSTYILRDITYKIYNYFPASPGFPNELHFNSIEKNIEKTE